MWCVLLALIVFILFLGNDLFCFVPAISFTLPPSLGVTLSIFTIGFLVYTLENAIKRFIKNSINPINDQVIYPKHIKLGLPADNSTHVFTGQMNTLGSIVYYNKMPKTIILGKEFIREFTMLPSEIIQFSQDRAITHLASNRNHYLHVKSLGVVKSLGILFSNEYLDNLIQAESVDMEYFISSCINDHGTLMDSGLIKINNTTEFLTELSFKNACYRTFGKKLTKNSTLQDFLYTGTEIAFRQNYSGFSPLELLMKYSAKRQYSKKILEISKIIELELNSPKSNKDLSVGPTNAIEILKEDPRSLWKEDLKQTALDLHEIFSCLYPIPPTRIINVLVDISIQPHMVPLLMEEQQNIIRRHGATITLAAIKDMKYLDAVILESLLLSSPASFFHRIMKADFVLSNGVTLPKNSLVSVNLFSRYNEIKKGGILSREFKPYKHLENNTKLKDISTDNLLWGYGRRACPFTNYESAHMKIVLATLLRKYYITSDISTIYPRHPGYNQLFTVLPNLNILYLEKSDVSHFV